MNKQKNDISPNKKSTSEKEVKAKPPINENKIKKDSAKVKETSTKKVVKEKNIAPSSEVKKAAKAKVSANNVQLKKDSTNASIDTENKKYSLKTKAPLEVNAKEKVKKDSINADANKNAENKKYNLKNKTTTLDAQEKAKKGVVEDNTPARKMSIKVSKEVLLNENLVLQKKEKTRKEVLREKSKKEMIRSILVLGIMLAITIAIMVYQNYLTSENSVFNEYDINNSVLNTIWKKIPAVIVSFQIITIAALLIFVLNFLLTKLFQSSNRQRTVMSLMRSLIKWVIIIIAILLILNAFGVNTSTLLASAGILALVIGLGAQSLIADIIAGFFIVFEEEYQVGDIITIDGFRGTVSDIGIRVTKLVDAGGNVKIMNNSDIKSIINQTSELSIAKCVMSIDYDESVQRVELAFKDSIDKIRKNIPDIVDGPYYRGVSQLGTSSVDLFFIAKCKEEDIYQVQRDLNRELYLMFKEYNITVPFSQVVVSNRTSEAKHNVTKAQKEEADLFVKTQVINSKKK